MKVIVIADTHNTHDQIQLPEGDVLIHCGDATISSTLPELTNFANWFNKLKYKYKIYIPGNHDWTLLNYKFDTLKNLFDSSVFLITMGGLTINGVRFFGCAPPGGWSVIPSDIDVLITHYPPHGILDVIPALSKFNKTTIPEKTGSNELRRIVLDRVKPRYHIFGHIHEWGGQTLTLDGTVFVNAAQMNEHYQLINTPYVFEIEKK